MSAWVRGIVEGFYDRLWTWEERARVVEFAAESGFDAYVYAPKTDPRQNGEWRTPYSATDRQQLARLARRCSGLGVSFGVGLRPVRISYSDPEDATLLLDKVRAYRELGADRIMILADDIPFELDERGASRFASLAEAQAWLVEVVIDGAELRPDEVVFVPTEYHGPGSPYLDALGRDLPPEVDVCWTGPRICSPTITSADANALGRRLARPPLIWDNYPVNDAVMVGELHIGPIRWRDAALAASVRGYLVNPAIDPEATLIPLATWGEYLREPAAYDPDAAWARALERVAGQDAAAVALIAAGFDRSVIRQGWRPPAPKELAAAVERVPALSNRRLAADLGRYVG